MKRILGGFIMLFVTANVYAVSPGGVGNQNIDRIDILQLQDDRTIQVEESTTGNFADAVYIESDDNNVNYIKLYPSATGVPVEVNFDGSDVDVDVTFSTKGDGLFDFSGNPDADLMGLITNTDADAGNTTVNSPIFYLLGSQYPAGGPAADVEWKIQTISLDADASSSQLQFRAPDDSAVLSLEHTGQLTMLADTNLAVESPTAGPYPVIQLSSVDNAVNKLIVTNSATGGYVEVSAEGTDADIDFLLTATGTGEVYSNNPIQTKHSSGFIAGNGIDEDFTLLSFDGNIESGTISWVTGNQEFQFSHTVYTQDELRADGGIFAVDSSGSEAEIGSVSLTLMNVTGATATATNIIPDGVFVVGVTTRVQITLGNTNGTTAYQVGDADADRWGQSADIIQGTTTDNTDATADATGFYTTNSDIVITAVGGNFDGTGDIKLTVHYITVSPPTA